MLAKNEILVDELRCALEYLMPDDVISMNRMNDLPVCNKDGKQIGFFVLTDGCLLYETMAEVAKREKGEWDRLVADKKAREKKEKEEMDLQPDPNNRSA